MRIIALVLTLVACSPAGLKIADSGDTANWPTRYETGAPVGSPAGVVSGAVTGPTSDTGVSTNVCAFYVLLPDGSSVVMANEVIVAINGDSPDGWGFVPGNQEVLRFDVHVLHEDCPDITVLGFDVHADGEDLDSNFWMYDMGAAPINGYNLSTVGAAEVVYTKSWYNNPDRVSLEATLLTDGTTNDDVVPAGLTRTFSVYADSTGASQSNDDWVEFRVVENSLTLSDGVNAYVVAHPSVDGERLRF